VAGALGVVVGVGAAEPDLQAFGAEERLGGGPHRHAHGLGLDDRLHEDAPPDVGVVLDRDPVVEVGGGATTDEADGSAVPAVADDAAGLRVDREVSAETGSAGHRVPPGQPVEQYQWPSPAAMGCPRGLPYPRGGGLRWR